MINSLALYNPEDLSSYYIAINPEQLQDNEKKKAIFHAMNTPDHKLSDAINMEINLENVYIAPTQVTDDQTGEVSILPLIVLIDASGESYVCSASGVLNALKRLFTIFGPPNEWKEPLKIKVKQISVKRGSMLTIDIV